MKRVGYLPDNERSCVVELILGPERILIAAVSAIGTVAWGWPLNTRSGCDLEVAETFLHRAFAPEIAVVIRFDRNIYLVAKSVEISCAETPHCTISRNIRKKYPSPDRFRHGRSVLRPMPSDAGAVGGLLLPTPACSSEPPFRYRPRPFYLDPKQ